MDPVVLDRSDAAAQTREDPARQARRLLENHDHFRGRGYAFQFTVRRGVLYVHGQVPSFYLKRVLQDLLVEVAGIRRVEYRVDVVSSDGLSSVRPR